MKTAMATVENGALTQEQRDFWNKQGHLIFRQCFGADEVAALRRFFDDVAERRQPVPDWSWKPEADSADPWKRYPRIMHPHRYNDLAKSKMLHPRARQVLTELFGGEPAAAQSMYYFKPPGSRGQALHQDNFYLAVKPGTCIAAWTAIDPSTPENGGLFIVPETGDLDIVCPEKADERESAFTHLVKPPPGKKAVGLELAPGDTLFFNGSVIHGSPPNRSTTLWRRSFICHYVPRSAAYVAKGYFPLLDFTGAVVEFQPNADGGPCGKEFEPARYGSYDKWH